MVNDGCVLKKPLPFSATLRDFQMILRRRPKPGGSWSLLELVAAGGCFLPQVQLGLMKMGLSVPTRVQEPSFGYLFLGDQYGLWSLKPFALNSLGLFGPTKKGSMFIFWRRLNQN